MPAVEGAVFTGLSCVAMWTSGADHTRAVWRECTLPVDTLILSLSKDEPFSSWFDKLTTSDV
jgi:hypothetical protein